MPAPDRIIQTDTLPPNAKITQKKQYFIAMENGRLQAVDELPTLPEYRVSRVEQEWRDNFLEELKGLY
ncbi:MAG: hypothetical protein NT076_00115 [Candidatus Pacearchaeota archaeon]|nr:hypothetical protein [Candidatus Pacearchaeota archaeon]